MMLLDSKNFTFLLLSFVFGGTFGILGFWLFHRIKLGTYQRIAKQIVEKAEIDADHFKRAGETTLKQQQIEKQRELESSWQAERRKIQREEERLKQREDKLEGRMNLVEQKLSEIEKKEALVAARRSQLDEDQQQLSQKQVALLKELELISGLSSSEAKEILINKVTNEVKNEVANLSRRMRKEAEEEAENEARRMISTAITRLAVPCVSEGAVNTVSIPNDEMKGRIIGREGRNIRALEYTTGVNFIIDETPGAVVLSGFDPIRIQIAKMSLTELVIDGRIHPTRIEEVVEKNKNNIQKMIKQYGEDAALRAGTMNLAPELMMFLGKLKFRYSFGQNILDHSLEVSYLMGLMAGELGLNISLAKRIGLLHDIGKAVSHEIEGSHAIVGHDLCLKYGETKDVATGVGCHHYEMESTTIEGTLCSSADAMSASRPGARNGQPVEYIKRLKKLEEMAQGFQGVDKAYVIQAGREVRVIVSPDILDDHGTVNLARDLTKKIENELNYPGKIKVTVIREKRAVEYAI